MEENKSLISLYLNDIKEYKLLTKEEELELLKKIQQDNDEEARQKLIVSNLRLVISVAKKLNKGNLTLLDLISEGNIGLIKAINKFDYKKGHRFSTYAVWWIEQSIKKSIMTKFRDIRIPSYRYEQLRKVNKIVVEYANKHGMSPSTEYISKELSIKESKIVLLMNEFQEIISLNSMIGENIFLEDVIGFNDDFEDKIIKEDLIADVMYLIDTILTDREKQILELRFGFNDSKVLTLKEIGEILGITRERVRQIEQKAVEKLKKGLKDKKSYI